MTGQTRRNTPREVRDGKKLLDQAFRDAILAKAALLTIHRVVRTMDGKDLVKQREAMEKMMQFADTHPLPADMESSL